MSEATILSFPAAPKTCSCGSFHPQFVTSRLGSVCPRTRAPYDKPKIREVGKDDYVVDFGNGLARIWRKPDERDRWMYDPDSDEHVMRETYDFANAMAEAWRLFHPVPAPLELSREEIAEAIREAKSDVRAAAKLMRKWLRMRTGRDWSVTGGRGTARSWLSICSPKARRVDRHGMVPPTKDGSYMSAADRALLGVILGSAVHQQGESIRTESGVREWYLWKIAGHAAPEDLYVAPPSWD